MSDQAREAQEPDPPHVREDYREVWLSGWRAGKTAAQAETTRLREEVSDLKRWKDTLIDCLVVDWCLNEKTANDPRAAIDALIAWNLQIHDDPAVSESARKRQEEVQRLKAALDKLTWEASLVVGFVQAWQPLSVGDIADLRRAAEAGRAALRGEEPQP